MTVKCKKCGNSYERKYRVCPQCGIVRFAAPIYLKVLAIIAGCYLILTAIMLPLGVFTFKQEPGESPPPIGEASPSPENGVKAPEVSDTPSESGTTGEGSLPPAVETPKVSPSKAPETGDITIVSDYGSHPEGFTWYTEKGPLQLSIDPKPDADGLKPEWKSSDEKVFTIDKNGLLTPIWSGSGIKSAKLTVTYGSAEESVTVYIAQKSPLSATADSLAPTPETQQIDKEG